MLKQLKEQLQTTQPEPVGATTSDENTVHTVSCLVLGLAFLDIFILCLLYFVFNMEYFNHEVNFT